MLLLTFNIADEQYAIETRSIIEIVPRIELKPLPMEEDYIAGIFDYHGKIVPVIDIARLCRDADLKNSLTTRIIIARLGDESIIGILADNLTQTVNIPPEKFASCGIQQLNAEFLGNVANHNKEMIQLVNVNQLLGAEVRSRLFAAVGAA